MYHYTSPILESLLTALHIYLVHPSAHQLKLIAHHYLFALDMDKTINCMTSARHQCAFLQQTLHTITHHSSSDPPETVVSFATDIIKSKRQLILLLREVVTSYIAACLLENEKASSVCPAQAVYRVLNTQWTRGSFTHRPCSMLLGTP